MKTGTFPRAAMTAVVIVVLLAIAVGYNAFEQNFGIDASTPQAIAPASAVEEPHPSALYGRVSVAAGETYEGRLRWGRDQEAFWGDYFNGVKSENPWAAHVPRERLGKDPIEIFGFRVGGGSRIDFSRQFMARFGDIARLESAGLDVRITLKSGTVVVTNYSAFNDLDDGVRVWDRRHGVIDVGSRQLRVVDLLPVPTAGPSLQRLHGRVRTRGGEFTGFIQWNRNQGLGADELGRGDRRLRFDAIRSIARTGDGVHVTGLDGREVSLSGSETGQVELGIYVDDARYGRVLVAWDAFQRLDFTPGGSGPAYGDFPPGRPLRGTVTTRDGRRLAGRLVYDLDESETTETLDAPAEGVNYMMPFGMVASIVLPRGDARALVTLASGGPLRLDRSGDLGDANGGLLVFLDGSQPPEYVGWADVDRIEFDRPSP